LASQDKREFQPRNTLAKYTKIVWDDFTATRTDADEPGDGFAAKAAGTARQGVYV
jgi:hypothetical protein